jgi:hypothetical protein
MRENTDLTQLSGQTLGIVSSLGNVVKLALNIPIDDKKDPLDQELFCVNLPEKMFGLSRSGAAASPPLPQKKCAIRIKIDHLSRIPKYHG